jgi:BASS family bile acid:Na+ symporter
MVPTHIIGPIVLFLLMTMVGLELRVDDFRRVFKAPRAVVGGSIGQWVLLPLMTWAVVEVMDISPAFGAGAILVAVSPGAGMSNIASAFARANVALSVTLTATASIFAVVTLPLMSSFAMKFFLDEVAPIQVPVFDLMSQLFVSLFVPIGFGMWLRTLNPERAVALAPRLQRLTFALIGIVVAIGIAIAEPAEASLFEGATRAAVAAGIWTALAGGIGWGVGTLLRLPSDDRFTFVIEFAARNIAVTAIVAMSGLGRIDLTIFSGLYGAVGYPMVITAVVLRRRFVRRRDSA